MATLAASLALAACSGGGGGAGTIAGGGSPTPTPTPTPIAAAAASRLLGQATMGATKADIASVQSLGFDGWISAQFAQPRATSHWDWLVANGYNVAGNSNNTAGFDPTIWRQMIAEPDQLRQRVGIALSGDAGGGRGFADAELEAVCGGGLFRRAARQCVRQFSEPDGGDHDQCRDGVVPHLPPATRRPIRRRARSPTRIMRAN